MFAFLPFDEVMNGLHYFAAALFDAGAVDISLACAVLFADGLLPVGKTFEFFKENDPVRCALPRETKGLDKHIPPLAITSQLTGAFDLILFIDGQRHEPPNLALITGTFHV